MSHYLIELLVFVAIAYLLGCVVGWILKNLFAAKPAEQPAMAAAPQAAATAAALAQPKGIAAARGGKPDELQRISGVGPKNEAILHGLGIFHFDQIANWSAQEVAWVDDHLRFGGRIQREEWIRQARLLADGNEAQFAQEFGTGGMKGKDGQTHSGSHTRKS